MPAKFPTLAPDLIEHAERFVIHLRADGYAVRPEASDISFPRTPTLQGSRNSARFFVEVNSSCQIQHLLEWCRYAKTRRQPTFVALVVPHGTNVNGKDIALLRQEGVGFYMSGDAGVTEIMAPRDLGVTISLPELTGLPRQTQKKLRPIYRQFDAGDYVGGFRDACQLLEDGARQRLKAEVAATRVRFVRGSRPIVRTSADIDRLTLGQLGVAHSEIVAPNQDDMLIGRAIAAVNGDRIGAVHRTNNARTLARIRENVARHMWTVVAALKVIDRSPP